MIKLRPWKGSKNEFEVDIIVTGPNGRTRRKRIKAPVTGRSHAERWARAVEQDLLSQLLTGDPEPERPPPPTFEAFAVTFLEHCKANRLGVNTLMNYDMHLRCYLLPTLGKRRLDQIRPTDITRIKTALKDKSHNTACEVLKSLRRMYNVALSEKLIDRVPVEIDIPRRLRRAVVAYDAQEQAALLAAAKTLGAKYEAFVLLGIDGGLRSGEILGLHWSDLNLTHSTMTIRHNVVRGQLDRPKGRTEDEVALTRRLLDVLTRLPVEGAFVFTRDNGEHFAEHNIKQWMRSVVKYAGIPWHGTHVLRKTCGTRIADGGGGVAAVATHLRHKDLQTASRYIDRRGTSSRAIAALES